MLIRSILVTLFLLTGLANAQFMNNETTGNKFWISSGIGMANAGNSSMPCVNTSLNYTFGNRIIKVRYFHAEEFILFGPKPNDEAWEYGLLYGYFNDKERVSTSFLAGISYTGGVFKGEKYEDDYERVSFETFGISVEVQENLNISKFVGLNFTLFGNLNLEKSLLGFSVNILIGHLK